MSPEHFRCCFPTLGKAGVTVNEDPQIWREVELRDGGSGLLEFVQRFFF